MNFSKNTKQVLLKLFHTGATGPTGADGSASNPICFRDVLLKADLLAFGSVTGAVRISGNIITTNTAGYQMGFVIPFDSTITNICGYSSTSAVFSVTTGNEANTFVQVYISSPAGNEFSPVGPLVQLSPSYSGTNIPIGTNALGNSSASIPVLAGDRIMLVATHSITGSSPYSVALMVLI